MNTKPKKINMYKKQKKRQLVSFLMVFALIFSNFLSCNNVVNAEETVRKPEILITEICSSKKTKGNFVEIYNATDNPINIDDYDIVRSVNSGVQTIIDAKGYLKPKEVSIFSIDMVINSFNNKYKININDENFFKSKKAKWGKEGFVAIVKKGTPITKDNYKEVALCYAEYPQMETDKSINYKYTSDDNCMVVLGEAREPNPGKIDPIQVPKDASEGKTIEVKSLEIEGQDEIEDRKKVKLKVNYNPKNTTQKKVLWSSSDENILSVGKDGTITAMAPGTATITVKVADNESIKATKKITVKSIKFRSIKDIRELPDGENIKTKGIVTGTYKDNVFIQDNDAAIIVYKPALSIAALGISIGDEVEVIGSTKDFHGLKEVELQQDSDMRLVKSNVGLPKPKEISSIENIKEVESQLVTIKNVDAVSKDPRGDYTVRNEKGDTIVKGINNSNILEEGHSYESITGIAFLEYVNKILVLSEEDVVEDTTIVQPVKAAPSGGEIYKGQNVVLSTTTEGANIFYTLDGKEPTNKSIKYEKPIVINEDVTIKAVAFKNGLKDSKVFTFQYKVVEEQKDITKISTIQGEGHRSPLEGQNVKNVKGVVTAIQRDRYSNGFYIQDTEEKNNKASTGIYIDISTGTISAPKIGDMVFVDGEVVEGFGDNIVKQSLTITQVRAENMKIKSNGNKLPEPIIVGEEGRKCPKLIASNKLEEYNPDKYAIDFYETLEGMLVEVKDPLIVGVKESIGEIVVVPDNGEKLKNRQSDHKGVIALKDQFNPERIMISDVIVPLSGRNKKFINSSFDVKVGDKFKESVVGVMSYSFGNYKLFNMNKLPEIQDGGLKREITHINPEEDKLTVASYNIENFSARSTDRLDKLADNIITNLKSPDIVALIEVQDNDGDKSSSSSDASQTLNSIVNSIKKQGGPEYGYVNIDPEYNKDGGQPNGNIRPTFIYRKDRVSLVNENPGKPNTAVKVVGTGKDASLSVNPGRIDPNNSAFERSRKPLIAEFEFKGEKIFAIANHFNSKGGDSPLFGFSQPQNLGSEHQRKEQAKIVNNFMSEILKANPEANIVCMGDLNDYQFSNPIEVLKGEIMTNMIDKLSISEQHTYVHEGNSQVLDHMLVSNKLSKNAKVDAVNINSEFLELHGRISDHDPILVQLEIGKNKLIQNDLIIEKLSKIDSFELGKEAKISIKAINNNEINQNVTLILAVYDKENNRMITSDVVTKKVSSKGEEKLTSSIMIPKEGNYKVKYFVWDDLESMKPLTKCETIKVK